MRRRRGPQFASATFALIVVLAVGALAWGAIHGSSKGGGLGSPKDQAAARTSLAALTLPSGFARDASFTACGNVADACLTAHGDTAQTLASLTTIVHSAGGTLPATCSASITSTDTSATAGPRFTCGVEGRLHGASVFFLLGEGWWQPGNPTPTNCHPRRRSSPATTPPVASPHRPRTRLRGGRRVVAADQPQRGPAGRSRAPVDLRPPESAPASSAPAPSSPSPRPQRTSTPVLVTTPPLPPCAASCADGQCQRPPRTCCGGRRSSRTERCGQGFRLDGHPCTRGRDDDDLRGSRRAHHRGRTATLRRDVGRRRARQHARNPCGHHAEREVAERAELVQLRDAGNPSRRSRSTGNSARTLLTIARSMSTVSTSSPVPASAMMRPHGSTTTLCPASSTPSWVPT